MSKAIDTLKQSFNKLFLNANSKPKNPTLDMVQKKRAFYAIKKQPKRYVSYEIDDIKAAVLLASNPEQPNRVKLYDIYNYIMQDAHLMAQIQTAIQKVIAEPFGLFINDQQEKDTNSIIQSIWFEQLLIYMLETEWYGFRMVELFIDKDKNIQLEVLPNENVCPELETIWLTSPFQNPNINYSDIQEDLSLLFFGNKKDLGILYKAAYNVIWKFYARSDWSRTSEKFGMPILAIEANTNNDAELDNLERRAANFAQDAYIITQEGDKVQIIERAGERTHAIFLENMRYCDEQNSKLINGQTGSSDEKSFAGSAEVHERTMEDFTFARMRRITYNINNIIIPYLKKRGILDNKPYEFSFLRFKENPNKNKKDIAEPIIADPKNK
jgi:hypothetical protein